MGKRVIIIGSGAGGLSSAILLAKKGCQVTVLEKNSTFGGRGSVFSAQGFQFDMGPWSKSKCVIRFQPLINLVTEWLPVSKFVMLK